MGQNIGYLARDSSGRDLAVLLFGAAAWRCAARDRYLNWSESEHLVGLQRIANNSRFLILPHVRVPHLASHLLALVARRISGDWQQKYGHGLDLAGELCGAGTFSRYLLSGRQLALCWPNAWSQPLRPRPDSERAAQSSLSLPALDEGPTGN